MTTEIKHIVFDIGKVLIHYDPHLPFARLIPDETERNWFFANICTHDWNIEQDRGRTWEEAEALLIAEHPAREEHIRAFRKYWHEMVPHAYEDSVAILEGLIAEGRDVTMLTNFASDTFREAQERFPFLKLPREEAYARQKELYRRYGTTLNGLMREHGASPVRDVYVGGACVVAQRRHRDEEAAYAGYRAALAGLAG